MAFARLLINSSRPLKHQRENSKKWRRIGRSETVIKNHSKFTPFISYWLKLVTLSLLSTMPFSFHDLIAYNNVRADPQFTTPFHIKQHKGQVLHTVSNAFSPLILLPYMNLHCCFFLLRLICGTTETPSYFEK